MKASVIIPAYNAERTMKQCLQALQKQTFKDFEAIVVDDGSTDRTPEIARGSSGVKLLQQKHAGPAVARNLGASKAKGDILVFLDSDCVASKNWLHEMLLPFNEKSVVGVQGEYENRQQQLVARFTHLEIEQRHEKMARQRFIDFMGSYSAAYRKSVFRQMKGFDTSFPMASGEDTDLSFRISKVGYKMVFNPKAVVFHFHPVSLGKYLKVKFFRAFWRTRVYRKHKGKILRDAYTSQTVKVQTGLFYLIGLSLISIAAGFSGLYYASILFVLLLLTTLPFALWAARRDLGVALAAPLLITARTVVFGFGLTAGAIKQAVENL